MDNHGLMQVEAVEMHETAHSVSFNQEKPEVSTHEENGHDTMEACELPSIDVMLESSVQNVQENAPILYENTKQNQYEPNDAIKLPNEIEDSEFQADHNQVGQFEVDQDQVLEGQEDQIMEMHESEVMEVHNDQVLIETTETLSFENTNEQDNSHIEQEEVAKDCELDGENGDLNPEEYTADVDENQYERVTDYVSEDYIHKEESLQQNNDTPVESNEYEHLTTTSEIQLSNEGMIDENPQEPNFMSTAEEHYEEASHLSTGEAEINEEEEEEEAHQPTYRQQNIINIAAASANIDIQDSMPEIEQEESKLLHTEVGSSSMEGVNIILNSGESVEENELLKVEDESAGDVIEEIYFIQDDGSGTLQEGDDVSVVNEVETVVTITQSANVKNQTVKEADLSRITQNTGISEKSRNVIQDIFDDWGDENVDETVDATIDENVDETVDEDNQILFRDQDAVEIELNNLLNEKKKVSVPKETQGTSKGTIDNNTDIKKPEAKSAQIHTPESSKKATRNPSKDIPSYIQPYIRGDDPAQGGANSKRKMQSPRLGVKVPSRLLKSQIASPAEVTEVLKERLREKQKHLESPQAADIVFVKKLTQRFASKICAGVTMPVPGLIPLSQPTRSTSENVERSESPSRSSENTDNKELLAILEGDVDPDWSNLRSQSSVDDSAETEEDGPLPKLSPTVQREIALKQLQEMPGPGKKRGRKKSIIPAQSKLQDIEKTPKRDVKEEITKMKDEVKSETVKSKDTPRKSLTANDLPRKPLKENDSQNTTSEIRIDETRSGRKRKPTEKALEQYATKRQKILKTKTPIKKDLPENSAEKEANKSLNKTSSPENRETPKTSLSETPVTLPLKEDIGKEIATDKNTLLKKDKTLLEKKRSLSKETPPSETPKKLTAKKLISQKVLSLKKSSINLQSKLSSPTRPVGRPPKIVTKQPVGRPRKTESSATVAVAKPRKKGSKEIDRLLQDEGVVNLLYDVGQPRTRRLVPITKSQKKVMDIDKAARDLNIRKKLVKNAVLKLRSSDSESDKISPRSKRTSLVNTEAEENSTNQAKSSGSAVTSPTGFIYPAKIRNAAEASVIVRRHSSSSFSSVSGSPRVSIDAPIDGSKGDDEHHALRSTKRKHSIDKDAKQPDVKRSKPKASQNSESVSTKTKLEKVTDVPEDKIATVKKQNKMVESKKIEKTPRSSDASEVSSNESGKPDKVTTRSNGATVKKVIPKNKKALKEKSSVSSDNASSAEETTKSQDELSACLAEAATALSSVSGLPRRTSVSAAGRKAKGSASVDSNTKSEPKPLFSNKEVNVRRNGNLVQLTLTPSSSKIVNGITLEVMQELRDILSILKTDDECRVVLLTSTGTSFCEGLDLSTLLHSDKGKRKQHAGEMANAVKDFIKCLATFTKPLVAGVQGAAVGLGVTILPLFDLVIASDKATFYTPYGKLGQIPEGAAIMTLSHVHGSAVASELLLGGRTLTASEALRAGLVTRVLWPERFPVELVPSVKAMSEQSSQSMEATKALLRQSLRNKLNAALESETHILVQHWCSAECQEAIKAYIARKVE